MLKSYFNIAWRNLRNNKLYSLLNIIGLAIGMSVAIIIGFWVWDEVSFDRYHKQYDRIARVMVNTTNNNIIYSGKTVSIPMGYELRDKYRSDFSHISLATHMGTHIIAMGDKQLSQAGLWVQSEFPEMFSLKMVTGNANALKDPSSILLAQSVAKSLFNNIDPLNKTVRVDNKTDLKVAGVYQDLPHNTTLGDVKLLLPWEKYVSEGWVKNALTQWENHNCQLFVQLKDFAQIEKVNDKIKNVPTPHITYSKEELMLHPMNKWHLYNEFKEGKVAGGRISLVWMIGLIGIFVLLLACINFMNLSTARSEKRSKEVGIRKTIGSLRSQLIFQFLSESLIIVLLATIVTVVLVLLSLPLFNKLSDKLMTFPWTDPIFWLSLLTFTLFTALIAGSYPAFYLSGFKPIKVLKGTFKAGQEAALPRKMLVVIQFTVSIALIIGTVIVYQQIQFASKRPVGYTREGLITIDMNTPDIYDHYDAIRNELLRTGVVTDMAQSNSAPTEVWSNNIIDWKGKDPAKVVSPGTIAVSHDFGNTLGWKILEGRDFSRDFPSDTGAFILNESAVKLVGFEKPVGQTIRWLNEEHVIVGVVKDMVMESPYQPIRPTIFHLNPGWSRLITIRINEDVSLRDGLAKIEPVFKKFNPGSPFVFKLTEDEYAKKFFDEKRIGNLTAVFALLAVFISCLGLFGLASFVASQRTKEIGIRKVLGASVFTVWKMLSKDFVLLVIISCGMAIPISFYFLNDWLQQYIYRTPIHWWIFVAISVGAILIALLTVTYQSIKAAIANPVVSLKSDC